VRNITDSRNSREERIGNMDWYYEGSLCAALIQNVLLQVHLQFLPADANCSRVQELDNIRDLLVDDPVPACITDFNSACLYRAALLIVYHGY